MVRTSTSALESQQPSTLVQHLSARPLRLSKQYGARFLAHKHSLVKWLSFGPSVRTFIVAPSLSACSNVKKFYLEDLIPLSYHIACTTKLNISMSFGGPSWPISKADLRLHTTDGVCRCHFDIQPGTDIIGSGVPSWIVGDTFLVGFIC